MYLIINKCLTAVKFSTFSGHYLRNRSNLDIGVLGYIVSHTQWLELHFVCVCIVLVNSVDARDRRTMVLGVVGDSE